MSDWVLLPEYLQRLWFVHSVAPDKSILNIGADVLIDGACPPEELRVAFAAAVGGHDAFRLCFRTGKAGPECRMVDPPQWQWRFVDLGDQSDALPEAVSWQVAERETPPLCPETGFVARATLYRLGSDRAMLAVTAHHLVADAWTIRVLVEDTLWHWRQLRGEAVAGGSQPASFFAALSRGTAGSGIAALAGETPTLLELPLDNPMPSGDRSRKGGEVAINVTRAVLDRLRHSCADTGHTPVAGLLAGFLILLADVCDLPTVDAGIVVTSRDPRSQGRSAGCFVQLAQVFVSVTPNVSPAELWTDVGHQILRIRRRVRRGVIRPEGQSSVMVSVIRDSVVSLVGPVDVRVRYERRRRTQAEAVLHVFILEGASGAEVVFNYDTDVLTASTAASWAARFQQVVGHISEHPHTPLGLANAGGLRRDATSNLSPSSCLLQHVGLAAWELDIALNRLASANVTSHGPQWEDDETGVVMALAGPPAGIQVEVVAPLRDGAPCVGALTREGEGPYHCCWRVPDATALTDRMERCHVEHSIVRRGGKSGLFPSESFTFLVVHGFGLVELLDGVRVEKARRMPPRQERLIRLCVQSDDLSNARRFLSLLGYRPCYPSLGPSRGEAWAAPDHDHEFHLFQAKKPQASCLAWVDLCPSTAPPAAILPNAGTVGTPEMATAWWSRVRNLCRLPSPSAASPEG